LDRTEHHSLGLGRIHAGTSRSLLSRGPMLDGGRVPRGLGNDFFLEQSNTAAMRLPRNLPELYSPSLRLSLRACSRSSLRTSGLAPPTHPKPRQSHGAGCSLITTGNCGNFTPPTYCCARNSRCCQTAAALYYCCVSNLGFVYRVMIWVLISNAFRSPPT
jgi:hypothetical protein